MANNALTNFQCPNCNGPLTFDPGSQKLKCGNCGSAFAPAEIEEHYDKQVALSIEEGQKEYSAEDTLQWSEEDAQNLRAYNCPSCGAQLIADKNTAATSCPYCGNPTIVPAQFSGVLKPDYVIPFKMNKDEAIKKLSDFYNGKPLLPNAFKERNHIEEIKGVYVPFWLYDGTADVDMAFRGTISHSHREGDYTVTVTENYSILRQGTVQFNRVPADGSSKMPDEFMDAIEPYNYNEMIPFEMGYMTGSLADRYDVTAEQDRNRVNTRMRTSSADKIRETVRGYHTLLPRRSNIYIREDKVHYAFLPVWMLTTKWQGKTYMFAMNGQTGKMIGDDLPIDTGKSVLYFFGILLIGMILTGILLFVVF